MATTNLADQLDSAFDRRLLYKIDFKKPAEQVRKKILSNVFKDISTKTIDTLTGQFSLTGGQIANIKKALLRVGATPEEQDAAIMSFRSGTMLNLQDTISLMSKQGAITEGERALIKNLNPDLFSDTRRTVLAKSQLVKARAEYDEHVNDVYEKWAEKNPNGTVRQFKQSSPEYQDAVKHYDNITYALAKKYFPDSVKAPSSGFGKQQAGRLESQIRN
jgi:SpoVK/Ycf46/Vps4 family AAA+-type ATPase